MRTLLVDDDGSFTHNLFHRLAEVNGREPEVVRGDAPSWRAGLLKRFDNVVLCAGPGSPHDPAGSGIRAELCTQGRLPVLGVGPGHHTIALVHGGSVSRAPWPCHGRMSPVRHTGAGLLRQLPTPLEVVRYHSLAVTGLSPVLEPIAWATDDGVVMALRHRDLPLWGVQFRPESVGTETGRHLLANFRELTERHGRSQSFPLPFPLLLPAEQPTAPARAPRGRAVRGGGPGRPRRRLRVMVERLGTGWEAEAVFDRLFRSGDHSFWLDSNRADIGPGRISVLGNADGPLARVATANVAKGTVSVRGEGETDTVRTPFLHWLEEDLRSLRVEVPELPFDFALGWVGCLGYELKAECGGTRTHRSPTPDAVMVFTDRAVVLDHGTRSTYLLALAEEEEEGPARAWLTAASADLTGLRALSVPAVPLLAPARPARLRLRHERERYLKLVDACREEVTAGHTYAAHLTNVIDTGADLDPWQTYRTLRRVSPAPFGAFCGFGALSVLSASPERLLRVGRDGWAESTVVRGSRPRGTTPDEDALLIADLATNERDRAEHLTLVDTVRHDLGGCAEVGGVEVEPLFDVETYPTAHRMVSSVRARLHTAASAVTAVRSAFPGASVTGAPRLRTAQVVDRLENGPRGLHTGAIGYVSLSGAADFALTTRTAVLAGRRLRYGIGAAVTAASDPDGVFEGTAAEAEPLLALLNARFPGHAVPHRTGTVTPDGRSGSVPGRGASAGAREGV
ncbi:chorismate-binding protein [Streptomyces tirandamycinicus]|uniref:chorismate-binding protein n=1 Tax=Streptomyces tirandamycinicus TaxID=2174846 RepID=UPI0034491BB2